MASLGVGLAVLIGFIGVFVWCARRARRGGGGATVGMLGAVHELLSRDRQRAGETIVERNAGKQAEADESGEPGCHGGRGEEE
jgi:hypothetical protein